MNGIYGKMKILFRLIESKKIGIALSVAVMIGLSITATDDVYPEQENIYTEVTSGKTESVDKLQLYAQSAVLMDAKSGRVLYAKNSDEIMAMASTTKIMTCIIALENGNLDDMVTISAYAASMPKVKLYLREGEQYKLQDLLYSLMLESHNDSAVAIAEHIGGSVEEFAKLMNQKAGEIGCDSTYFITPNGLDAVDNETGAFHSTTATDLAKIMSYCVDESEKREEFLKITQTQSYSFTNSEGRSYSCVNHNALLTMIEGAVSGKTGFTNKAGYCYVGTVQKDDRLFTVALLACGWPNNKSYKWSDCKTLFKYGFDTYHYKEIFEKQIFESLYVIGGIPKEDDPYHKAYANLKLAVEQKPLRILMKDTDVFEIRKILPDNLEAPIDAGTTVGTVVYSLNGEVFLEEPVVITETVRKQNIMWFIEYIMKKFIL